MYKVKVITRFDSSSVENEINDFLERLSNTCSGKFIDLKMTESFSSTGCRKITVIIIYSDEA